MLPKRQIAERLWDLIADRYRGARDPDGAQKEKAARRPRAGSAGSRR